MSNSELIEILKKQHDGLQEDLVLAEKAEESPQLGAMTVDLLQKFRSDLLGHLAIEDVEFYPNYLKNLKDRNRDITDTEAFIAEMNRIKEVVIAFLNKYNTAEKIDADKTTFSTELKEIKGALNVRIETEEEGVYAFYLLM